MRENDLLGLASLSLDCLQEQGISVEAMSDLGRFEARMKGVGKKGNYPMISTEWHDLATDDAFGIILVCEGVDIGGMAARVIDLGRDTLKMHWESSYRRMYSQTEKPIETRVSIAHEIQGRVVYQGELYLAEEWRGGRVNLAAVMHYAHTLSALKWRPSWIYGFVRHKGRSAAPVYGFTRIHLSAHRWLNKVEHRGEEECLVALTYDELCETAEFYSRHSDCFGV